MRDEYWMQQALVLAQNAAAKDEIPVGAVVVSGDELIGSGCNQPIQSHDPTQHAEIVAIRQACKFTGNYRLPGCALYVTVEPCMMCAGALVHARIERLIFGAREPKAGAVCSQHQLLEAVNLNHKVQVRGAVLEQECAALMADFFKFRRRGKKHG